MPKQIQPTRITDSAKRDIRMMFLAKHALSDGSLHPEDGNHATYHHELVNTLRALDLNLEVANTYQALYKKPDVDFVFTMLNRGGFLNSEMLAPILCTMHGIPFMGSMPFLRGLGDDKSTTKALAKNLGIKTADWFCYRRGAPITEDNLPARESGRWVIKPNASSASWGICEASDFAGVKRAIDEIQSQGHDAIVEPYIYGSDIQCSFITVNGQPEMLPMLWYEHRDGNTLWTYNQKRDIEKQANQYELSEFDDPRFAPQIRSLAHKVLQTFVPFDFGRVEFRVDFETNTLNFIEVNLSCNLWSQKFIANAALLAGLSHSDLIETIVAESWIRHGLMDRI